MIAFKSEHESPRKKINNLCCNIIYSILFYLGPFGTTACYLIIDKHTELL